MRYQVFSNFIIPQKGRFTNFYTAFCSFIYDIYKYYRQLPNIRLWPANFILSTDGKI